MRRLLVCALFAVACCSVLPSHIPAGAPLPPKPAALRLAGADVVIVGEVTSMEDKEIMVKQYPFPVRVMTVRVSETITGAKDLKTIRMASPAQPPRRRVNLKVGDEGLFYLMKTDRAGLYLLSSASELTAKANPNFAKEVAGVRADSKLFENPLANLKSDDAAKRFRTAALLVGRYRYYHNGDKLAPIAAEESKLILKALADANWEQPLGRSDQLHPQMIFNMLSVSQEDGWRPPMQIKSPQDLANAIRAWLREHANTYRVQRFVPGMPPGNAPTPR